MSKPASNPRMGNSKEEQPRITLITRINPNLISYPCDQCNPWLSLFFEERRPASHELQHDSPRIAEEGHHISIRARRDFARRGRSYREQSSAFRGNVLDLERDVKHEHVLVCIIGD